MVGTFSDIGNVRSVNEDYLDYCEDKYKNVYIIADGMGGHNAGEVASKMAVEETMKYINAENWESNDLIDIEDVLVNAIEKANRKIFKLAQADSSTRGMGTTITACIVKNGEMVVANVGDSSCFIIFNNKIHKATKDHSLVQQLVDMGSITENEAKTHPNKNIITRALGTNYSVKVDTFFFNMKEIEKVILCTDGLTNSLSYEEILEITNNNEIPVACEKLIDVSKEKDGRDNISVIIFEGACENDRNSFGK